MANPTFNSTSLTSAAPQEFIGAIDARVVTETLPDVDGMFAQLHGQGARDISVRGMLKSSSQTTAALAVSTLKTTLRTNQALADGVTVASYVGEDGNTYTNCILMSYEMAGAIQVSRTSATSFFGYLSIIARIRQLAP